MTLRGSIYCVAVVGALLLLVGCDKSKDMGAAEVAAKQPAPDAAAITLELSQGNLGMAAELAKAATQANPSDPALFLLLARIEARRQNVGNAVSALKSSFDAGFHDPRGALDHPDFDGIRNDKAFAALVSQYAAPAKAARKAPASRGTSSAISAGDVSIIESSDGHSRIRAGDIEIRD